MSETEQPTPVGKPPVSSGQQQTPPDTPAPDRSDRDELRHHGDAEVGDGLTDLAVNVWLSAPPAWLRERLAAAMHDLAAYPKAGRARAAVAARHGRSPAEVLLTAGAAEAFVLIARALEPVRPVVVNPQFTEPGAALRACGHRVGQAILEAADGFVFDTARVPADADLVAIGNPTNPTSVLHPAAAIASLARPGRVLVVDEAFMDAVPGELESLAARRDLPGLVVIRSLTKTWALAGLRVGYVLAEPGLVDRLIDAQAPWAVSTPALVAAESCSTPAARDEAQAIARQAATDRACLLEGLRELPHVEYAGDPQAPFVLVWVPGGLAVREALRQRGYAVRRGDTFPGLGQDWLRIAVRGRDVTDGFLTALREVLA